ncbi:BZ3500_MvSof-1268-A1-R1_Chr9g10436 [Microbotryum saponariae]|uniref:BZ3500_MvSof-1268-A1-R1_Chr9g10436 protein n=1 Tax=Microbotryum saponariae TaxID=289078 RepID=A0A2X0L3Q7_9BASI|nr:BZ3501_MvSof-1269-A2-R1_Chr9g10186 [Microbotryum saponariae]SDA00089.1 BZ3500_MvSof-1268-A1-R1_Chr9g10436 [Microbotryum saponariae]
MATTTIPTNTPPTKSSITFQSYPLPLNTPHSSLPPLYVQVTRFRQSVLLSLGSPTSSTSSYALMSDFSVALPPMKNVRRSAIHTDVARRYQTQVYLSLDLGSFSAAASSSSINGELDPMLWLEVEKGLINVLDRVLGRERSA